MVELSFAPEAVTAKHQVKAIRAQIRYKARLLSTDGQELGIVVGEAQAREANTAPYSVAVTENAKKAVEAMYEQLAATLLAAPLDSEIASNE